MNIGELFNRSIRIFHISKKPTPSEFWEVAKITSLGMIVIGVIGVVLSFVLKYI